MLCEQSEAKRQLAPAVLGLARQLRREKGVDEAPCQRCFDDRHLCFGGVEVHVERANFDHRTLDSIRKTCIVFAPKLSTRGPNGFWVIERGPEHPLTKQFAEASAWIQEVGGGRSVETLFCYDAFEASGPTLFATQEAGLTEVAGWIQDDPEAGYRLRELRGSQVLEAIAGHDLVECWDSSGAFPLTQRGKEYVRACEDEALTLAQFSDYAHGKTTEAA